MNHDLFVIACIQLLQIQSPIEIRMRPAGKGKYRELAGVCETRYRKDKVSGFVLIINMDRCIESEFSLNDVIAHELVHAIMIENDKFDHTYHHDSRFQKICHELQKEMIKAGFKIGDLYSRHTDTD